MQKCLYLLTLMIVSSGVATYAQQKQKQPSAAPESIARGKEVYTLHCMSCHLDEGQGIEGLYPPLAKSDYLMNDKARSIATILNGLSGEIVVNGTTYNMEMMPFNFLTDEEITDVLNYVRNSWGNKGEGVTPDEVSRLRN